jgi:2-methylcitrate dehydratase
MLDRLLERFRQGDRFALSRLVSLLAAGENTEQILGGIGSLSPNRYLRVVALTGSPGVGKSTLTGKLIEVLRSRGLTVAVLACDPQSPISGGALLGDRFRMRVRADDDGVFIRSLAAPGGRGALAEHLDDLVQLLAAFGRLETGPTTPLPGRLETGPTAPLPDRSQPGFDLVLIETVGAGQGDTTVQGLADVVVLLLQPETGDDLQWEKAGVLEVADIVVVHKGDLPGAAAVESQVQTMLALGNRPAPPILRVSSRTGGGITELLDVILAAPLRSHTRDDPQTLLAQSQSLLGRRFALARESDNPALTDLLARWQQGQVPPAQAALELARLLIAD